MLFVCEIWFFIYIISDNFFEHGRLLGIDVVLTYSNIMFKGVEWWIEISCQNFDTIWIILDQNIFVQFIFVWVMIIICWLGCYKDHTIKVLKSNSLIYLVMRRPYDRNYRVHNFVQSITLDEILRYVDWVTITITQ